MPLRFSLERISSSIITRPNGSGQSLKQIAAVKATVHTREPHLEIEPLPRPGGLLAGDNQHIRLPMALSTIA
jgi:hypothetical protein